MQYINYYFITLAESVAYWGPSHGGPYQEGVFSASGLKSTHGGNDDSQSAVLAASNARGLYDTKPALNIITSNIVTSSELGYYNEYC